MPSAKSTTRKLALDGLTPRGLFNSGVTCFVNVVIQVLAHTPIISTFIASQLSSQHECKTTSKTSESGCLLCLLATDVKEVLRPTERRKAHKSALATDLAKVSSRFKESEQSDCHELLLEIFEKFADIFPEGRSPAGTPAPDAHPSLLNQTFGGTSCTEVQCAQCMKISPTTVPITDVSVPILDSKTPQNLEALLKGLVSTDRVEGYRCDQCETKGSATTRTRFQQLPKLLTVNLQRFQPDRRGSIVYSPTRVVFPEVLDMGPVTTEPAPCLYRLYGVTMHTGATSRRGHYTTAINSGADRWSICNDQRVTNSKLSTILAKQKDAYLLHYTAIPAADTASSAASSPVLGRKRRSPQTSRSTSVAPEPAAPKRKRSPADDEIEQVPKRWRPDAPVSLSDTKDDDDVSHCKAAPAAETLDSAATDMSTTETSLEPKRRRPRQATVDPEPILKRKRSREDHVEPVPKRPARRVSPSVG
ncbi:hypothetical protein HKX48_006140 [Thoreauomyces humboldtii]|nr:hypothetical protein HKX48_006140 [Thoreauomyces humboldtii]